jgi:hypothetical protein
MDQPPPDEREFFANVFGSPEFKRAKENLMHVYRMVKIEGAVRAAWETGSADERQNRLELELGGIKMDVRGALEAIERIRIYFEKEEDFDRCQRCVVIRDELEKSKADKNSS